MIVFFKALERALICLSSLSMGVWWIVGRDHVGNKRIPLLSTIVQVSHTGHNSTFFHL